MLLARPYVPLWGKQSESVSLLDVEGDSWVASNHWVAKQSLNC